MRSFSHVLNCLLLAGVAGAQDFSIQFASPVAAQSYQMKRSAFVFRTVGCADDVKPEVSATAEGRVEGHRRSVQLKIAQAAANPNVFGIFREWPNQGVWIVNIKARCAPRSASALVATDAKGLVRESSKVLDRFATEAEIEALLNTGKKTEGRID
jgi:hypothetical protein